MGYILAGGKASPTPCTPRHHCCCHGNRGQVVPLVQNWFRSLALVAPVEGSLSRPVCQRPCQLPMRVPLYQGLLDTGDEGHCHLAGGDRPPWPSEGTRASCHPEWLISAPVLDGEVIPVVGGVAPFVLRHRHWTRRPSHGPRPTPRSPTYPGPGLPLPASGAGPPCSGGRFS